MMERSARGAHWAIATPHTLATEAGAVAFERGGNAIDAAVAAAVTLAVVYPHMCGLGGDLFALVQHPAGDAVAVNASGRAPSAADPEVALVAGAGRMPERGPHTVTVPGAVSGWHTIHDHGGTLPWGDLFAQAIALAHGGVAVAPSLAAVIAGEDGPRAGDALGEVFAPDGVRLGVGDLLRQPALGISLRAISEGGPEALYGGPVGRAYVEGLRAAGVPIDEEDLASHHADLGSALRARYRELDVLVHPPNSQGFVLLELLRTLERLGVDPDPFGPDAASLALAARATARDRDLHLADPDRMQIHPSTLLDDGHLAALSDEVRGGIDAIASATDTGPGGTHPGDTIALVTADSGGRAVSLIQSLFYGFGSGILEPTTGIVAQNRGACFTLEPGHANRLAPGSRPAHTLMPVLVQREGALRMTMGSMGGFGQPQINAWNLIRAFDLGLGPADAVAAPRWLVEGLDRPGDVPTVLVDPGVPDDVRARLADGGFRVDPVDAVDPLGHAHMIRVDPDGLEAGSDPRADGGALAG
jgi:gamma-glutamyltranspeptidase